MRRILLTFFGGLLASPATAAPLQYLTGSGQKATPVTALTWGVLCISIAVIGIIGFCLAAAVWRRPGIAWRKGAEALLLPDEGGTNWLWIGVGLSIVALLVTVVWTVKVLAEISRPPAGPAITIEVTGFQWWWQVRYLSSQSDRQFITANEIHIPVGQPVRLRLIGGDVIHSFWVPQLAGKMDAIPGQTNETWIEAERPGIYSGQCTEYCGLQHAHMGLLVVADPPEQFAHWWTHQLAPPDPSSDQAQTGQRAFQVHCASCHAVRGTEAAGTLGPDLSHMMARRTLAAGTLPNTDSMRAHWISDPQSVKPGALMPAPAASARELSAINAYLRSLD